MGLVPRLAPENSDNSASRLDRIRDLIRGSKYAFHDLSRNKSNTVGEYMRQNMPFELGMDHGCREFGNAEMSAKSIMVLESARYDFQKSLSDISGWDIYAHENDHLVAVGHVRNWLIRQAGVDRIGRAKILTNYATFQEWYWEREIASGASERDIQEYPTIELVDLMQQWVAKGRPF